MNLLLTILTLYGFWCCQAQTTVTKTDPNGQTIVEVISTDVFGAATTQFLSTPLQTLVLRQEQGPVGAPGTGGTGTGPTPYTYTTVINGATQVVSDNFTPTFPPTLSPSIGSSGTAWNYDDWSKIYATATQGSGADRVITPTRTVHAGWTGFVTSLLVSLTAGIWVIRLL